MSEVKKIRKITPALRKKYKKDWGSLFINFYPEHHFILSRRVGPLLIALGFDVRSGLQEYRPGFGVQNLCSPIDFRISCLHDTLRTERNNARDVITIRGHEAGKYIDAAKKMKSQFAFLNEDPISLSQVIEAYKDYFKNGVYISISTIQDPPLIAAWAGKAGLAKELLEWSYDIFKDWDETSHNRQGGLDTWYHNMQEKIANPQRLREIVEEQAIFHKVDHIPVEELVIDI